MSLATVSGFMAKVDPSEYCLIWIDAHADSNTFETSPSGNLHGMPIAGLLGSLSNGQFKEFECLKPTQVFLLGIRDVDPGEWTFLENNGIKYATMKEIKEQGLSSILDTMSKFIGEKKVY